VSAEGKKFPFKVIESGKCITGDQFIDNQSKVKMLSQIHEADCIEMEAFAFLSAAREFDVLEHCIILKGISDGADMHAKTDHEDNLQLAMNNSVKVLDSIIKSSL
jgi:nucleoside phosphorylase